MCYIIIIIINILYLLFIVLNDVLAETYACYYFTVDNDKKGERKLI